MRIDGYGTWAKKDKDAVMAFMTRLRNDLTESGELVATDGLAVPDQAVVVRSGKDGAPITDGVFPESKEFLAGYWIIDVKSPERASRDHSPGYGSGTRSGHQWACRSKCGRS